MNQRRSGFADTVAHRSGSDRHRLTMALAALALGAVAIGLGGCNTTAGLGQDVSATGHAVTNSADKVKNGL